MQICSCPFPAEQSPVASPVKVNANILDTSHMVLHAWSHALCTHLTGLSVFAMPLHKLVFMLMLLLPVSQVLLPV